MTRAQKLFALAVCLLLAPAASAQEDIIDAAIAACQPEIDAYCSQVTPGDGRMLACFYAHGDKISPRCEYALYEAATQLEQFVDALTYLASSCWDDLEKHCAEVEMGEGRVATCLLDHKAEVSDACRQAMEDTELEVSDE
jgi:hypothetical protein